MTRLCVVPCGKAKVWDRAPTTGPTPARHVYTGPFAGSCRRYAERFYPGSWVILSAKYGFLEPDDEVPGPYEVSFVGGRTDPIGRDALARQAARFHLSPADEVTVVAGSAYVKAVREALGPDGPSILTPLDGVGGMFKMIRALRAAVEAGTPLLARREGGAQG